MKLKNSQKRHMKKAISWRLISIVITTILAWVITGDLALGAVIGSVDAIIKLWIFYLHERAWHQHRKGMSFKNIIFNHWWCNY